MRTTTRMATRMATRKGTGMRTVNTLRGAARAFALAATAALLAGAGTHLGAQDAPPRTPRGQRGPDAVERGAPRTADVEAILRLRERLELRDDQVARLDELRRQEVARRAEFQRELAELRSRLRAGEIRRSELMAYLEEHREAMREARQGLKERVDAVLDDAQKERLSELTRRGRAFRAGRAMAMRRGALMRPGGRGGSWAPGRRRGWVPAPGRAWAPGRGAARLRGGRGPVWRRGLPGAARPGRGGRGLG